MKVGQNPFIHVDLWLPRAAPGTSPRRSHTALMHRLSASLVALLFRIFAVRNRAQASAACGAAAGVRTIRELIGSRAQTGGGSAMTTPLRR
jgi:hypothetical protein